MLIKPDEKSHCSDSQNEESLNKSDKDEDDQLLDEEEKEDFSSPNDHIIKRVVINRNEAPKPKQEDGSFPRINEYHNSTSYLGK